VRRRQSLTWPEITASIHCGATGPGASFTWVHSVKPSGGVSGAALLTVLWPFITENSCSRTRPSFANTPRVAFGVKSKPKMWSYWFFSHHRKVINGRFVDMFPGFKCASFTGITGGRGSALVTILDVSPTLGLGFVEGALPFILNSMYSVAERLW